MDDQLVLVVLWSFFVELATFFPKLIFSRGESEAKARTSAGSLNERLVDLNHDLPVPEAFLSTKKQPNIPHLNLGFPEVHWPRGPWALDLRQHFIRSVERACEQNSEED